MTITIDSTLKESEEVVTSIKGLIGLNKTLTDFDFVKKTSAFSYEVEDKFETRVVEEAATGPLSDLSVPDFVAWARAKCGRNDERGRALLKNERMSMIYLAYATAIALEKLPDWIRDKCTVLEDKSETLRSRDNEASEERADKYDELREEYEPYAEECEGGCIAPAEALREALESGNLDDAVEAIENGDLFLDIGLID